MIPHPCLPEAAIVADMTVLRALACLTLLAACAAAQDSNAAVIRGVTVEHSTSRPLARTQVRIRALGATPAPATTNVFSDAKGQFAFPPLAPGVYALEADRAGFAVLRYGQKKWNGAGTPITVGEHGYFLAELRLRRLGAVSGTVFDENGVGMPGMSVSAITFDPRPKQAGSAVTDDRGIYRIAGLEPGRHYIRSAARESEGRYGLLPTYSPQSARRDQARAVDVKLDEEASGVDISPLPGRLLSLAGIVSGAGAQPVAITLAGSANRIRGVVDPGGQFRFDYLEPGDYEILAETEGNGPLRTAWLKVSAAEDNTALVLRLAPAPVLRLTCLDRAGRNLGAPSLSMFVYRRPASQEENPPRLSCGESMSLTPGDYDLSLLPAAGVWVASILGAQPSEHLYTSNVPADKGVDLRAILNPNPGSVRGVVTTSDGQPAPGAPVYLRAWDPDLNARTGGTRQVRADPKGQFGFTGLPPGSYEVIATFELEEDPTNWRPGRGKEISVQEGTDEKLGVNLEEN